MPGDAPSADEAPVDVSRYRAPIGTHDVLPPESNRWIALVSAFACRASRFGFERWSLLLNSMGDERSRPAYVAMLREYLLDHAGELGGEFRARVEQSPLRVLDSKRDDWHDVIERAPQLTDHLSDESRAHFE